MDSTGGFVILKTSKITSDYGTTAVVLAKMSAEEFAL